MDNKYTVSNGNKPLQPANGNTFIKLECPKIAISFTPSKVGAVTPANNEKISLERRRKYQYYENE